MNVSKNLTFLLLFSLFIPIANAEVHFEPWVAYALTGGGDTNRDGVENEKDENLTGPAFGARVGYAMGVLSIGAEYFQSNQSLSYTNSSNQRIDVDIKQNGLGAFLGFDVPVLPFRFVATYFFGSDYEYDLNGTIIDLEDGSGFKAGLAFTALPFIELGLFYQAIGYDTVRSGSVTSNNSGDDIKTIFFSLAIPL